MTAQTLYNQLVQGTISENKFLYEVRRDPSLTMITKFNSFEDTIQILKTKSIISEETGKYKVDKNVPFPKNVIQTIDQVSPHEYSKGIDYELDLKFKSVGNNMPTEEEMVKAQKKVLSNLSNDQYYYTKKCMSDIEKKQEKENKRPEEVNKNNLTTKGPKNLMKESHEECESCEREMDVDTMDPSQLELLGTIIDEWGLVESDMEDEDVMEELADEFYKRWGLEEAIAVKDKAGNIQYAKDDGEATNIMNAARTKGVQLTKQNV
jgi:hypothetical protein